MKVYVVLHGECSGGGRVVSVHKSRQAATKSALKTKCCFPGGWVPDNADGELTEVSEWVNGCDFVIVREHEVEP